MGLAELERYFIAYKARQLREAQEKATFDYIQADLMYKSILRVWKNVSYPRIEEVYPTLFDQKDQQEKRRKAKEEASVNRFMLFAQAHNQKFNQVVKDNT